MPETPDFDQIARQAISGSEFHIRRVAEQLRQVWNARGAADVAQVNASLLTGNVPTLVEKLRRLDR